MSRASATPSISWPPPACEAAIYPSRRTTPCAGSIIPNPEHIMTRNIAGKVVVITGASSGLGEAAARQLARSGAKLVLGARRLDRLQSLAAELSLGADAAVQTDVTRHEQVKRLVDRAVQAHGRIDVILN